MRVVWLWFEQDPIHAAIGGVERLDRYRAQTGAARERIAPDAGDTAGNRDPGQGRAGIERISPMLVTRLGIVMPVRPVQPENVRIPDAGDAAGDRDAGQGRAGIEYVVPDAGDAVGDRDAGQAGAVTERVVPNARDAVRDRVVSSLAPRA